MCEESARGSSERNQWEKSGSNKGEEPAGEIRGASSEWKQGVEAVNGSKGWKYKDSIGSIRL